MISQPAFSICTVDISASFLLVLVEVFDPVNLGGALWPFNLSTSLYDMSTNKIPLNTWDSSPYRKLKMNRQKPTTRCNSSALD